MKIILPEKTSSRDLHQIMLGSVIPRPVAFVSTIDDKGIRNLAPFSYFNAVSSIPPKLMISISRKADGSKKDTLVNIENTKEFVVNMVTDDIVRQMTIAGYGFENDVDEFVKSGLSPVKSHLVSAWGIQETSVRYECKLDKIIELGTKAGECSIIIGDVLCIHIDEHILENNRIIPEKTGIIGRLGGTGYLRITKDNVFNVFQHRKIKPLGYDNLPGSIVNSKILTGNEIAEIAGLDSLPAIENLKDIYISLKHHKPDMLHKMAKSEISKGNIKKASEILIIADHLEKNM